MKTPAISTLALVGLTIGGTTAGRADHTTPAVFTVTNTVLRPAVQVPPLGANNWGRIGAIEWAANNFVHNAGNEPVVWRNLHRAITVGENWFEIDGPGTSHWELWGNGFLSGAQVRVYRIVDASGAPLPVSGGYLDLTSADHVAFVGPATIVPAGDPERPDGGWVVTTYGGVYPNDFIGHGNLRCTDYHAVENGRTYWYTVVALGPEGEESTWTSEASGTPQDGLEIGPRIVIPYNGDPISAWQAGQFFEFTPTRVGGQAPFAWEVLTEDGEPLTLPAGVQLDTATGRVYGTPEGDVSDYAFLYRVTDGQDQVDTRRYVINGTEPGGAPGQPAPPTNVQVEAGDGYVTVSWDASPSDHVRGYRVLRSVAPGAEQEQRVYLSPGAPELAPYDYIVLQKYFVNFDMSLVHPRVRGIGNPVDAPNWYWNADLEQVDFTLVPHPEPVPAEMVDPGETCLQVAAESGSVVMNQYVFIGTEIDGENHWYGYLEAGRQYRLEVWLRQVGLGDGGTVRFDFRPLYYALPYPDITAEFAVDGTWQKFTYDFVAPEGAPPTSVWHYGPALTFSGPGTLWLDNFRIFRGDTPEEAEAAYVPNATVFDELMESQPAAGRKGAHRIWFLSRDATMDSILSWHANSRVNVDWVTSVGGTLDMTLPMGLEFDRRTGDTPEERMVPWLVLQHVLHSEQDWLNLVEYLAAPYEPGVDTPETKPYAHRRYQQRGVPAPWTDEFTEILIEFGNETWHNGVFDDWLGFHLYGWVHQGGPEYGLFAQYLADVMKSSPYWNEEKLHVALGGNYDGWVDGGGGVHGYVEEALFHCPDGDYAGHANYVGPKWETGDSSSETFDDHGVQETLVGFLTNVEARQQSMGAARERAAELGVIYEIVAYEGGPSGYALPGQADAEQVETNERYGKSLAMAVATMDAWMRSYRDGWTHQAFFSYGQGSHWNSHTVFLDDFRPSPGWLAATMRNRFANGDLLAVIEESLPTYERSPGEEIPLAGAYALCEGDAWSVLVVSRKLDGEHDGIDFGDGYTPVTLNLPFDTAEQVTLHTLTGDPRESNRFAMNIDIASYELPAGSVVDGVLTINEQTGGTEEGMPPGSIYLYVLDETIEALVVGDLNCDGVVGLADINPFVLALSNPDAYQQAFPGCDVMAADCNADGSVDVRDIHPFVVLLVGGG